MNTHTKLNISAIAGVKGNIHEFISLIERNLDAYGQNLDDYTQLDACRIYVHQLNGLFEMLELHQITRVITLIEQIITALIDKKTRPDQTVVTALKQTLNSLPGYLDTLVDGAEENPMRLFPIYRNLMRFSKNEQTSEFDLFYPRLMANPPLKPACTDTDSQQNNILVKQARSEYQTGMVQWLKNSSNKDGLKRMRNAIAQVEQLPGSTDQRTVWWVSSGFLDCLLSEASDIDMPIRKLCGKIEKTLRRFTENSLHDTSQLTRELLYQIAHYPMTGLQSKHVTEIHQSFALPSLTESDMIELTTPGSRHDHLMEMRAALSQANENWQAFCSEHLSDLAAFLSNMTQLRELALQVQSPPLQTLIASINHAAQSLQTQSSPPSKINERITMEIATALLHLESIVENFNNPPADLSDQVEAISLRLHASTDSHNGANESPAVAVSAGLGNPTQQRKSHAPIIAEVLVNLHHIEKTLEQFFQTPTEHTLLSTLAPLFIQAYGVFDMLNLHRASHLLKHCQHLVEKFSDPSHVQMPNERDLLVDGLSSLEFFLEAFRYNQTESQRVIDSAIAVFENAVNQKTTPAASAIDTLEIGSDFQEMDISESEITLDTHPQAAHTIESGIDPELLSIFLEEADEILAEIGECIHNCRTDSADIKSLTVIRRGYHTLKGSGRMIKLEHISEAAWNMEQMLNHWLNEKKQPTPELIGVMEYAHQAFSAWCSHLKATGKTEVRTDQLLNRINRLGKHDEQAHNAITDAAIPARKPDAVTATGAPVFIGDISIPVEIFEIFVIESRQHLATLKKELEALLIAHPATIQKPFVIATHTLGSTSRALKLNFVADLCSQLEKWGTKLMETPVGLKESETQLIQNGVQHINELLDKVHQQQFPDETDLQLAQFLAREITKQLTLDKEPVKTARLPDPINLNEYRLKKAPSFIQTETRSEQIQTDISVDATDHLSAGLRKAFLEEVQDIIPQINARLRAWRILPQNEEIRITLLRLLHTMKGSAHMIGAKQLGALIHSMEGEIEQAFSEPVVSIYSIEKVEYEFDQLCERIEHLQKKETTAETPAATETADNSDITLSGSSTASPSASPLSSAPTASSISISQTAFNKKIEETSQTGGVLRVNAELIDRLVNDSGESSIIRAKIETQLNNFKLSLQDLSESVDRLHGQLREMEIQAETHMQSQIAQPHHSEQSFDPLEFDRFTRFQELARLMAESIDDVLTVQKNLSAAHSTATEAVAQQAVINHQLQQELIRIRTVPFGSISERYYRITRKTAGDLGKKANLTICGEDIEIDRSVLEKMSASLEHILRNAIVHGIESPNQRRESGKPEIGQILMDLHREGNEVIITVSDDGSGLNLESIREEAIKRNLINENEHLDDDQIATLIFSPGLTTHDQVTDTAGRGIGMDIVQNDISGLGGHITVSTEKNKGTIFHIQLPLTLAVAQTLLVSSGNQIFAIPSLIVEQVQELNSDALQSAYQHQHIDFAGALYPFTYLSFFLGQLDQQPETKRHNHILLLQSGDLRLAILIDELIGSREVIVKNTSPQIMHAPGVEGATLTGEGRPVLILNPLKLLQREDVQQILKTPVPDIILTAPQKQEPTATVLIVDDSLTMRKVIGRLLEREGYRVLTAKQGLEAVEILSEIKPDIILSDLEMPRMSGFELIQYIRKNPDTAQIPIIIISSRTADKHRRMAQQLGANEFLGKPYKEEDLLEHIACHMQ